MWCALGGRTAKQSVGIPNCFQLCCCGEMILPRRCREFFTLCISAVTYCHTLLPIYVDITVVQSRR